MKKLHRTQESLLNLLSETFDDPLTIRELQERLDLSSPSLVYHHIQQLVRKGFLKRNPSNPNDYQIVSNSPEKQIVYLNLYGLAQCGRGGDILDGNPIDRIPISSTLISFRSDQAFLVKARGESMIPKINNGDIVIAQNTDDYKDGDIVVCVNDDEALIKKIHIDGQFSCLISLNPAFPPIPVKEPFKVQGIVKSVISYKI